MAVYTQENFDGTAVGSVPTTLTSTTMQVTNVASLSTPNSLTVSSASTQSSAWTALPAGAPVDGRVRAALITAATTQRVGVWLRHNGAAVASQTGYLFSLALGGGGSNNGLNMFSCSAGAFTQLGTADILPGSFSLGAWYNFDCTAVGSVLNLSVQRASDNMWLASSGSWQVAFAVAMTRTDTTITAAGRGGIELFGGVGNLAADNFYFTDPADTTGQTGSATFPAQQIVAGTSAAYLSTGNSSLDVSNAIEVIDNGWYCKFTFSGTALALRMDMGAYVANSLGAGTYGNFIVSIDGGSFTRVPITGTLTGNILSLNLATGLAASSHTAELIREIRDETDMWSPADMIKITHFLINASETLTAPSGVVAVRPKRALILGDSITQGYAASDTLSPFDFPPASFAHMLLAGMNAEGTQCGRSAQGWIATSTASGGLAFPATWNSYYSGKARVLSGFDYLFVCHGTNDTASVTSTVQTWIASARAAVGGACWILLAAPFSGGSRTGEIAAAVAAYNAATPSDTKVVFLDTSTVLPLSSVAPPNAYKLDIHPTTLGHAALASVMAGMANRSASISTVTNALTFVEG